MHGRVIEIESVDNGMLEPAASATTDPEIKKRFQSLTTGRVETVLAQPLASLDLRPRSCADSLNDPRNERRKIDRLAEMRCKSSFT